MRPIQKQDESNTEFVFRLMKWEREQHESAKAQSSQFDAKRAFFGKLMDNHGSPYCAIPQRDYSAKAAEIRYSTHTIHDSAQTNPLLRKLVRKQQD